MTSSTHQVSHRFHYSLSVRQLCRSSVFIPLRTTWAPALFLKHLYQRLALPKSRPNYSIMIAILF